MDIIGIGYGMMAISFIIAAAAIIYLRMQKKLHEKGLLYGLLANFSIQVFAYLFVYTDDFVTVLMNGAFMALISYNMITIFGIRKAHIYEKDQRAFLSFFAGNTIISNAIGFILLGYASIMFANAKQNASLVEALGQDVVDQLAQALNLVTIDYLPIMLIGTISSVLVTYAAMTIFVKAHHTKMGKINLIGTFVLFSFYVINLYVPLTDVQKWMQMGLYAVIAVSSYIFMNQVKNSKIAAAENK